MNEAIGRPRDVDELCCALATARRDGGRVASPAFDFDLDQAYAIQERVAARLDARQVGWKVGSTSAAAQARLGTREPGTGALLDAFVYPDGGTAAVWPAHDVQVEVEFAFRISAALAPREQPYEEQEVRAAIGAFVPAMELVGSRFASGLAGSGRNLVTADGGANIGFVGGCEVVVAPGRDYRAQPCTLRINGVEVARGTGAEALGDPVTVLTWLANHLRARGRALDAGAIVTTGTCTGLVEVAPGDHLVAAFGDLGEVSLDLVAA